MWNTSKGIMSDMPRTNIYNSSLCFLSCFIIIFLLVSLIYITISLKVIFIFPVSQFLYPFLPSCFHC